MQHTESIEKGSWVHVSGGCLHRCRWAGKAMLFLLSAHAHRLLLFALSLCVPFQGANGVHVSRKSWEFVGEFAEGDEEKVAARRL